MSAAYSPGEIVNIAISGARVRFAPGALTQGELAIDIGHDDGPAHQLWIPAEHPSVRIARVVPAEGEPQAGEVWRDQAGGTYFARLHEAVPFEDDPWVELLPATDGPSVQWLVVHNGPSGPIERVWRPDPPKPEPAADEPSPATSDEDLAGEVTLHSAAILARLEALAPPPAAPAVVLPPSARCTCDHARTAHTGGQLDCRRCGCDSFVYAGGDS